MKICILIKDILMYICTYQLRWEEHLFNCYQIKDYGNLRLCSEDRRFVEYIEMYAYRNIFIVVRLRLCRNYVHKLSGHMFHIYVNGK
jgi:hypothetical protein